MITAHYDKNLLYQYYSDYVTKNTNLQLLSREVFTQKILENTETLVSFDGNINGFISCSFVDMKGYITLHFGELNTKVELLEQMEKHLLGLNVDELWFHFFNPVRIPFYPLKNIAHPGVQGVDYNSQDYKMYDDLGYIDNSLQHTYYLDLEKYVPGFIEYPSDSISIELYNAKIHNGLFDFTSKLNAPQWKQEIVTNMNKKEPLPLLVSLDNSVVMGFTGPLAVSVSGRGYFAGIGVLHNYQGQKIGKYLFHNLCQNLKNMGARYMTLFTGENNIAKYIYLKAGFQIVATQMTMKKIIGSDSREI